MILPFLSCYTFEFNINLSTFWNFRCIYCHMKKGRCTCDPSLLKINVMLLIIDLTSHSNGDQRYIFLLNVLMWLFNGPITKCDLKKSDVLGERLSATWKILIQFMHICTSYFHFCMNSQPHNNWIYKFSIFIMQFGISLNKFETVWNCIFIYT